MSIETPALGLADLEAMAAEIDPQQDRDSDLFRASVVVLACLFKGTDASRIAEDTGYDTRFVEFFSATSPPTTKRWMGSSTSIG